VVSCLLGEPLPVRVGLPCTFYGKGPAAQTAILILFSVDVLRVSVRTAGHHASKIGRSVSVCHTRGMIEQVTREEILPLRHTVLRPNLPLETAKYPEDAHPEIFHLAFRADGAIIACVTFLPQTLDNEPGWRFRGMATAAEHRSQGIGGELLEAGITEAARRGAPLIWCRGRTAASAFYQRHQFVIRGDEFDVPPIGPHFIFVRDLASV
jgi:predicted GNAT family N-acyltransferase